MFKNPLRSLFRGARDPSGPAPGSPPTGAGPSRPRPPREPAEITKQSHGIAEFVGSIRDESGLAILDLGELCQPNVTFITNLGHRLSTVDFLRTLDAMTAGEDPPGGPSHKDRIEAFLDETLRYDEASLDGALVWDCLEFLSRPLLLATVARLHAILRPGAYMLALFHTDARAEYLPSYSYRIAGHKTLQLAVRVERPAVQCFNNRDIERLFQNFSSVKFFLSRDNLREAIVRR